MSEIVSIPINNLESPKLSTCPICAGLQYNPSLYDQLCCSCRRKFLWVRK